MIQIAWVVYATAYLVMAVAFLYLTKKLFDLLTPYSVEVQLTGKDNPAVGLVLVGFLLGVTAIVCGAFAGEGTGEPSFTSFTAEVVPVIVYALIGMALLFVAGIINDKVVLYKFSNHTEIVESRNMAVAAIMSAAYVGSGLIIGGGIHGSTSIVSALVAFVLGQVALVAFALLYQAATKYDYHEEIGEKKNAAAGVAFAGNILAFSIILMRGVSMDATAEGAWSGRLVHFLYYAVAGCVLLVIMRIINDRIFLPSSKLSREIVDDQNLSAGFMSAGLALAIGTVLIFCL